MHWIPFLSYASTCTFTPGPNNLMALSSGTRLGYNGSLRFLLGMAVGLFVVLFASAWLNLALSEQMPVFIPFMRWVGVAYMLYLAWHTAAGAFKKSEHAEQTEQKTHRDGIYTFFPGLFLQLVNFKLILYGLTVTSNFILPHYRETMWLFAFSLALAFLGFISLTCWALFGSLLQKFLARHMRAFNGAMALLLIYCAYSLLE